MAGAEVDIYSKDFDEEILNLSKEKKINLKYIDINKVSDDDLKNIIKNYDFIVTAVNEEINDRIKKIALKLNKFINSSTEEINFIIPACVVKDDVIFSIYTKGKSPLVAKEIRKIVENYLDNYDLDLIFKFRAFLKDNIKDHKKRKEILNKLFSNERFREELLELIKKWENDYTKGRL